MMWRWSQRSNVAKFKGVKECWYPSEVGTITERLFLRASRGNVALLTPWFWTSRLQNYEIINSCCVSSLSLCFKAQCQNKYIFIEVVNSTAQERRIPNTPGNFLTQKPAYLLITQAEPSWVLLRFPNPPQISSQHFSFSHNEKLTCIIENPNKRDIKVIWTDQRNPEETEIMQESGYN